MAASVVERYLFRPKINGVDHELVQLDWSTAEAPAHGLKWRANAKHGTATVGRQSRRVDTAPSLLAANRSKCENKDTNTPR